MAFTILVTGALGTVLTDGNYVYIDADAAMPALSASAVGATGPMVNWQVAIRYQRSGRNDIDIYPQMPVSLAADAPWDIIQSLGNDVRGGEMEIRCEDGPEVQLFHLSIRGTNPDDNTLILFVKQQIDLWYAPCIAKREGREIGAPLGKGELNQFSETGASNQAGQDVLATPRASADFGFGIMQLTTVFNRKPNPQELWSWKQNLVTGCAWIAQLQTQANSWMNDDTAQGAPTDGQRVQARKAREADPNIDDTMLIVTAGDQPPGNPRVTFQDGTACVIEHAVAIKLYNGSSNGYYCSWKNNAWNFNNTNSDGRDYVNDVCNEV